MAIEGGFAIMAHSWTIGSQLDCDLVVASPRVSGRHCRLTLDANGYVLEDLDSTDGTYVNGVRLTGRVRLSRIDKVTLGVATRMPWPPEKTIEAPPGAPARGPSSTLDFQGEAMVIGRAPDCDHVLNVPMVSGRHARVFREDDRIWIEDLGSLNGTYLNGHPVKRKTEVVSGDEIHLGTCDLILRFGPQVEVETVAESPVGSSPPPPRAGVVVSLCRYFLQRLRATRDGNAKES
jgi:pSer/pThr/pTyr-binding forkhead associated (FHA) protein